jgi:hypothetical protein
VGKHILIAATTIQGLPWPYSYTRGHVMIPFRSPGHFMPSNLPWNRASTTLKTLRIHEVCGHFYASNRGQVMHKVRIELDAYRAEQGAAVVDELIHGDCLDVHCPVESCGLAFLNPPYDWTTGETPSKRTERVFLTHTYRWLKVGGVLVLVVPGPCPRMRRDPCLAV